MRVLQYRDFAIDRRVSMEIYADQLFAALESLNDGLEVEQFAPTPRFTKSADNLWRMRFNRYQVYPNQVRRKRADIHHVLDHGYAHLVKRLGPGRSICTVHDLIPYLRWIGEIPTVPGPGETLHRPGKKPNLNIYSLQHLAQFDRVIAISENTKRDLMAHFGLEEEKISVVPLGVPSIFHPVGDDQVKEFKHRQGWCGGSTTRRVLITGMEFYKNHHTALQVFEKVAQQADMEVRLVRAGQQSTHFDDWVGRHGLTDKVDTVFMANHDDMALLYNSVDCLLFPSLYDGFGMPVVEALACGTPVVTSNVASLPEITSDFVFTHNPEDIDGMVESVNLALFNPDVIQAFANKGPDWSSQFLWSSVAEQTAQIYRDEMMS